MRNVGATDGFRLDLGNIKVMLGSKHCVASLRVTMRLYSLGLERAALWSERPYGFLVLLLEGKADDPLVNVLLMIDRPSLNNFWQVGLRYRALPSLILLILNAHPKHLLRRCEALIRHQRCWPYRRLHASVRSIMIVGASDTSYGSW